MNIDGGVSQAALWAKANQAAFELDKEMSMTTNEIAQQRIDTALQRLRRLQDLKTKLDGHEKDLKLKYLIVLRERNAYLEKVKTIEDYLFNKELEDDENGLLEQLRGVFQNFDEENQ